MDPTTRRLMQGAAGAVSATYIEDVFSTWLYSGNGSTQTITNGIDLSGKGGLVWIKYRSGSLAGIQHALYDTTRGANKTLESNGTQAELTTTDTLTAFNSSGFTLGADITYGTVNYNSSQRYSSWTFRKQQKFFDVVTWTTTGGANQRVTHNLGTTPGTIIVKAYSTTGTWYVWHRSLSSATNSYLDLSLTSAEGTIGSLWGSTGPTSTDFGVPQVAAGQTWVAYLFAHDTSTDGLVQCGSYTGNGSTTGPTITLGWEPQWVLIKRASGGTADWHVFDNMRGIATGGDDYYIFPNKTDLENAADLIDLTSTGFVPKSNFTNTNWSGSTYIYIAIRRGPMKTPTDATKVFTALAATGSTNTSRTVGFPADLSFTRWRSGATAMQAVDRLRGMPTSSNANALLTSSTAAEAGASPYAYDIWNTTAKDGSNANLNDMVWQYFRRAPGFFDAVAYTGTGLATTISHNLGVVPELMIVKKRSTTGPWMVYHTVLGNQAFLRVNETSAAYTSMGSGYWNSTSPTSSVFSLGNDADVNTNAATYIAYLFVTCPGVSKVGSYTGSGTTKQIDCGFTAGARFVLIKRTDSTGDWYVWDSARGIVAGNDPYLLLNSTAAEVTSTDYVDTYNAGFELSSTAPAAINANGGSFVFLAVA